MDPKQKKMKIGYSETIRSKLFAKSEEDDQECHKMMNALDTILNKDDNNTISKSVCMVILKEICEYANGKYIKCQGKIHDEECDGYIHYLCGDNFGMTSEVYGNNNNNNNNNTKNNLSLAYGLFKYKCDDSNCSQITHLVKCKHKNCNDLIYKSHIEDQLPESIYLCQNALWLTSGCRSSYCNNHWSNNGEKCASCHLFYCKSCINKNSKHCIICNKFVCNHHDEKLYPIIHDSGDVIVEYQCVCVSCEVGFTYNLETCTINYM